MRRPLPRLAARSGPRSAPRLAIVLAGAAALALPAAASAQSESRVGADLTATGGYSSNPFTTNGNDAGTAVVTVDVSPHYQLITPRSTLTASADANIQQYLARYGHNISYSGALDYQGRPSERTTAHARIDLSSAVLGAFNSYLPLAATSSLTAPAPAGTDSGAASTSANTTGTPVTTAVLPAVAASPLVPYTDVGLFGLRNRRRSGRASGDLGFTVSARDTISASAFAEVTRYSGLAGSDYEDYGGSLSWRRRLSSKLTVGLLGSASSFNYHGDLPDSQGYSVQATASAALNDRWSADGALGVSFVSGNGNAGPSTRSTSLSGNIALCRRGPRSVMCAQAARQVSPTGLAGTQYVTTAGLSWNRQLDERQGVSLSATYSDVGGGQTLVLGGVPLQTQYVQAVAGYSRRLGRRLSLVASANYRELIGDRTGRGSDYGGQVGLSYRLGDRR